MGKVDKFWNLIFDVVNKLQFLLNKIIGHHHKLNGMELDIYRHLRTALNIVRRVEFYLLRTGGPPFSQGPWRSVAMWDGRESRVSQGFLPTVTTLNTSCKRCSQKYFYDDFAIKPVKPWNKPNFELFLWFWLKKSWTIFCNFAIRFFAVKFLRIFLLKIFLRGQISIFS